MHLGSCMALKTLEPHSAIAWWDSYASFVFSNLPSASKSQLMHANPEPIVKQQVQFIYGPIENSGFFRVPFLFVCSVFELN